MMIHCVTGEIVRHEKALDLSGCKSTRELVRSTRWQSNAAGRHHPLKGALNVTACLRQLPRKSLCSGV